MSNEQCITFLSLQDIRSSLPDLEISSCSLDSVTGGGLGQGVANRGVRGGARIVLARPELLDSWPGEHPSIWVKNKEVMSLRNYVKKINMD